MDCGCARARKLLPRERQLDLIGPSFSYSYCSGIWRLRFETGHPQLTAFLDFAKVLFRSF